VTPKRAPIPDEKKRSIYTIVQRAGRTLWIRVGIGFVNRDDSINLYLDALPVSGQLQVRQYRRRDEAAPNQPGLQLAPGEDGGS
jgi:hypothetical protein